VIEAIEGINTPVFGVQWHPEKDLGDPIQNRLFEKFVAICRELRM
jgi:gamma-glutamyl-gamma-aminobutyrate hydrolase PuuD